MQIQVEYRPTSASNAEGIVSLPLMLHTLAITSARADKSRDGYHYFEQPSEVNDAAGVKVCGQQRGASSCAAGFDAFNACARVHLLLGQLLMQPSPPSSKKRFAATAASVGCVTRAECQRGLLVERPAVA
jgi:hypothetical protein